MRSGLTKIREDGLSSFVSSVRLHVFPQLLGRYLRPAECNDLIRLGTDYGGWWVPNSVLRPEWVGYCAGAGEDISFDIALHDRGLKVVTLDPTPRAMAYVSATAPKSDRFVFVATGLWDEDTTLRFYAPRDPTHVSHSVVNLQGTEEYFTAAVKPLKTVMDELGDSSIDLLKLDIEGAEHRVIESFLKDGVQPRVFCVEFDQPSPVRDVLKSVSLLKRSGYKLVKIDFWNYTFVKDD